MKVRVERTGGIGAFAKPLGGVVELDALPEALAAEAREAFDRDRLERSTSEQTAGGTDRLPDGQTITLGLWEHDSYHSFTIADDGADPDLFDLCNAIVNEIVRDQLSDRTGSAPSVVEEVEEVAITAEREGDMSTSTNAFDAVFFDIGDTLVSSHDWVEGADAVVGEVRKRDVALGIISNTGNLTRPQVLELLPDDFDFGHFDADLVVLSSEVQLEKPDPRIFLLAAQRAATVPSRCLFFGENLAETIAAQRVGFQSVRLGDTPAADFRALLELLDG